MPLKTLRDVSGLGVQPPALGSAALVMVDCQNTYREGVMQLVGVEPALAEAQRLLQRARAASVPIFHIRHDAGAGSPYDLAEHVGQISAEVAPVAGEAVVTKRFPNAFVQTELEQLLRAAGVTDVILAGFMTHMCISSTARAPSTWASGRPWWPPPPPRGICPGWPRAMSCRRRRCRRRALPGCATCSPSLRQRPPTFPPEACTACCRSEAAAAVKLTALCSIGDTRKKSSPGACWVLVAVIEFR